MEIKKSVFSNHHVIKIDTVKDNITGLCTGKGKVSIRCNDPATQKVDIMEKLTAKGIQAAIKSQKKMYGGGSNDYIETMSDVSIQPTAV